MTSLFVRQLVAASALLIGAIAPTFADDPNTVVIPADGKELSTQMGLALGRLRTGGVIQLEAGEYTVARQLDPAGIDHITIRGRGSRTVIKFAKNYFDNDDRWIMNLDDDHDHWIFEDFTFDGNSKYSPEVCDRDKIIKLKGNYCTIQRVTVRNEAGRGFATILGNHQRWQDCNFYEIGTHATDSSVIHPGNKNFQARRILVTGCVGNLGINKVTFVDAVASDVVVTNNVMRGGKTGVILSWWKGKPENCVISNNILINTGRSVRLNRKRKGEYPAVIVTNNVMTGPLDNQFGKGFVNSGNTLYPATHAHKYDPPLLKEDTRGKLRK